MMKTAHRGIVLSLQVAVLSALLVGCFPTARPAPTGEDVVGTWANGDTQLVIAANGTFTLTNAPFYAQVGKGDKWGEGPSPVWDDSGPWGLESDSVRINGQKLFYDYVDSELILEFGLDLGSADPRCFRLVREGSGLDALGPEDCFIRP